jgi:hypothetical protein
MHIALGKYYLSSCFHYLTSYTHMKNYCEELYPNHPEGTSSEFYSNCALALTLHKGNVHPVMF